MDIGAEVKTRVWCGCLVRGPPRGPMPNTTSTRSGRPMSMLSVTSASRTSGLNGIVEHRRLGEFAPLGRGELEPDAVIRSGVLDVDADGEAGFDLPAPWQQVVLTIDWALSGEGTCG